MYIDPYDECRVVRQQELKTNVGKVITLKEYSVYPNFLRKYYVIDIDGVEWLKTEDSVHGGSKNIQCITVMAYHSWMVNRCMLIIREILHIQSIMLEF